jgi:hypothetical protein
MVLSRSHPDLTTDGVNAPVRRCGHGRRRGACCLALSRDLAFLACALAGSDLRITKFVANGSLTWTNAPVPGICTLETASAGDGTWTVGFNCY